MTALGYFFDTRHGTDGGRLRDRRTVAGLDGQQRLEELGRCSGFGFFGGALAVGVAKPFIKGRGIDVFLSIGGQF